MTIYVDNIEMDTHICGECGVVYATTKAFTNERRGDHKTFFCPNGHRRYYPQESKTERLERQLKSERQCCISAREEANRLEKQLYGMKGFARKMQKKAEAVKAGD